MKHGRVKHLIVALCGFVLVAMLPVAALAGESPVNTPLHAEGGYSGASLSVDTLVRQSDAEAWELVVEGTDSIATLACSAPDNIKILVNFSVYPRRLSGAAITDDYMWERATSYDYVFTVNLNTHEYDGKTAHVYVDHHDGSCEEVTVVIVDGTITLPSNLFLYTFAVDVNSGGTNPDLSPTSPKTGLSNTYLWVSILGTIALVALCGLAVSLRTKKVH